VFKVFETFEVALCDVEVTLCGNVLYRSSCQTFRLFVETLMPRTVYLLLVTKRERPRVFLGS
jgi:hypothetical protein